MSAYCCDVSVCIDQSSIKFLMSRVLLEDHYVEKPNFLMFLYKAFMPISMGVVKGVARQASHDML